MKPRALVIHTVGVRGDASAAGMRKFHMAAPPAGNGWKDLGYHWVIRKNGRVETGRPATQMGSHLKGANDTWGVCMSGDGDSEVWTPEQWASLIDLAEVLCRKEGWTAADVIGHREGPAKLGAAPTSKTCPGRKVDMAAVRAAIEARLAGA